MNQYHISTLGDTQLPSVIINYLHVVCVSVLEPKADPPSVVDGHCPLAGTIVLEFVQTHTSQWADILQADSHVEHREQILGGFDV